MTMTMTTSSLSLLLLLVLSATPGADAMKNTLFDAIVPTSCVNPLLQMAGFCVLNNGCADRCFGRRTQDESRGPSSTTTAATKQAFDIDSQGLENFYIPVDAVECDQLEDPICPATDCCPSCKAEIDELYRCIILEGDYHYLDYLATTCPLSCDTPVVFVEPPVVVTAPPTATPTALPTATPTAKPTAPPTVAVVVPVVDSNMTEIDSNMTDDVVFDDEFEEEEETNELVVMVATGLP